MCFFAVGNNKKKKRRPRHSVTVLSRSVPVPSYSTSFRRPVLFVRYGFQLYFTRFVRSDLLISRLPADHHLVRRQTFPNPSVVRLHDTIAVLTERVYLHTNARAHASRSGTAWSRICGRGK